MKKGGPLNPWQTVSIQISHITVAPRHRHCPLQSPSCKGLALPVLAFGRSSAFTVLTLKPGRHRNFHFPASLSCCLSCWLTLATVFPLLLLTAACLANCHGAVPRNPCAAPRNPMVLCLETPGAPRLKTPRGQILRPKFSSFGGF